MRAAASRRERETPSPASRGALAAETDAGEGWGCSLTSEQIGEESTAARDTFALLLLGNGGSGGTEANEEDSVAAGALRAAEVEEGNGKVGVETRFEK